MGGYGFWLFLTSKVTSRIIWDMQKHFSCPILEDRSVYCTIVFYDKLMESARADSNFFVVLKFCS